MKKLLLAISAISLLSVSALLADNCKDSKTCPADKKAESCSKDKSTCDKEKKSCDKGSCSKDDKAATEKKK